MAAIGAGEIEHTDDATSNLFEDGFAPVPQGHGRRASART